MRLNFRKKLTTTDLITIGKYLGLNNIQVYSRDDIPSFLDGQFYVINLDNHLGGGTHWTCFFKNGNNIAWMDSFGMPPPQEELDVFKNEHDYVLYNKQDIQDMHSILCGYFCLAFLHFSSTHKGTPGNLIKQFGKLFSPNTKDNDGILINYFRALI